METKGAGAGQLTVRVRGPKGAFNVEMQREKKQERTIHCKYEPKEPGDYQVIYFPFPLFIFVYLFLLSTMLLKL